MGRRKTQIIHEDEGLIRNIKWSNDLIAWCNEKGVKVYSLTEKRMIAFITKDHDPSLRDELYKCSLLWPDPETLVIGWADRFKICKVVRRAAHHSSSSSSRAINSLASSSFPIRVEISNLNFSSI